MSDVKQGSKLPFRYTTRSFDGRGNCFLDAVAEDGTAWVKRITPLHEYGWVQIQALPAQEVNDD